MSPSIDNRASGRKDDAAADAIDSRAGRLEYYQEYWRVPQIVETPYLRWKAAFTRAHPLVTKAKSVLDVGCGDGFVLEAIGRRDTRLCGVDVADVAVARVRERGFEGEVVDLEQGVLPYPSGTFDVALCYDVLEHLFSPGRLLREIGRVTRQDGALLLCVPNTLNVFNRMLFLLGDYVDVMDTSHSGTDMFSNHIRLFSKALFEKFVQSEGLRIEERHFYFPDEFSDSRFPLPRGLTRVFTSPRLPQRLPALFALGFLYVCRKVDAG